MTATRRPIAGWITPTWASSGVVRAAPLLVIELVAANWNVGGITAWTTTPEALPGPRLLHRHREVSIGGARA